MRAPILFAVLLAGAAHAQVCPGTTGPATLTEAAPEWVGLPCVPDTLGGTGKGYGLRVSSAGVVPWVWCPSGTGWALRWGALTWADAAPLAAELPAALVATDKRAALAALGHIHMSRDIADPDLKALWCPHWAAMRASMPSAEVWVVAPAPLTANPPGTRPAFPWAAGVRGTLSNGRATAGQACNTAVGASPYFGVNGRSDQVAVCAKQ